MSVSSREPKVYFFFETPTTLRDRRKLKSFVESIFKSERKPFASLNVIFCSDSRLLEVNRQYLDHDYYTDIITFDVSNQFEDGIVGEIYISVDRVRDNARTLKVPIGKELHRVLFHGVLHLCGYKDKSKMDISQMRGKEDLYLRKYSVSRETR